MSRIRRIRKALAALATPVVALPIGTWALHAIDSDIPLQEPFSWRTVAAAVAVGVQSAIVVWSIPNAPQATPADPAP